MKILGFIIAAVGIVASAYFGLVVMFVGGIEQIVDQINATTADGGEVAWGIARIIFAWASFGLGCFISGAIGTVIGSAGD